MTGQPWIAIDLIGVVALVTVLIEVIPGSPERERPPLRDAGSRSSLNRNVSTFLRRRVLVFVD
jgi:hypothetical protein